MNISGVVKVGLAIAATAAAVYVANRYMMVCLEKFRAEEGAVTEDMIARSRDGVQLCNMLMMGMTEAQKDEFFLAATQILSNYEKALINYTELESELRIERDKTLGNI